MVGTSGHALDRVYLEDGPEEVDHVQVRDPARVAWLSQTTLSVDETSRPVIVLRDRFPLLVGPPSEDIRYATQNRQTAVKRSAESSDLVIVVGSSDSSNSVRLVEVTRESGRPGRISSRRPVTSTRNGWIRASRPVGVTSGASVPEHLIAGLLEALRSHGFNEVRHVTSANESITFALSKGSAVTLAAYREEPVSVFIVSTGRCGSTLLSNMMRLHPDVLSVSEFFAMLIGGPFPTGVLSGDHYTDLISTPHSFVTMAYRAGVPIEEFLYRPGPGSAFDADTGIPPILVTSLPHLTDRPDELYHEVVAFTQGLPPADVATQHRRLFEFLRHRIGGKVWVERSGFSLRHLQDLLRLFPEAKFVHLFRDGRECAYSMSRNAAFRLGKLWLRMIDALGVNPFTDEVPTDRVVPDELKPLMPGSFDLAAFERIDLPLADFARDWRNQITDSLPLLDSLTANRLLSLSYEQLTADPTTTLTRLADFIGPIPVSESWLTAASRLVSPRPPRWRSLPEEERAMLTDLCAPVNEKLYETCGSPDHIPAASA